MARHTRKQIRDLVIRDTGETPITKEWSSLMKAARKAQDISQPALARMLGVTQASISHIETFRARQSKLVPAICAALDIPLPVPDMGDELDERWLRIGRKLRGKSISAFLRQLDALESILED